MEINKYIEQKKNFYNNLLNIIENDGETHLDDAFNDFLENLDNQTDQVEFKEALELISKISENHYRGPNFMSIIEKIFLHFSDKIKQTFTNEEIFDIFKDNKRILLLLIQIGIITFDNSIIQYILSISQKTFKERINYFSKKINELLNNIKYKEEDIYLHYYHIYFYPEIKDNIDEEIREMIMKEVEIIGTNIFDNFEEKRKNGENENYICELMRSDSIEDFVAYVTKNNISLKTIINPSIFETNILLIKKPPTLIEYAAFYGSIQIVQYLKFNNVDLNPDLWIYSIHSNNPQLIHFLEENQVEPPNDSFKICLKEAIKCHHNNIADYIIINLIKENDNIFDIEQDFNENITSYTLHLAAKNDNIDIVNILLSQEGIKFSDRCLEKCKSLIEITIPSSVTSINDYAFHECSSLKQVSIPSSVTSIGKDSFGKCSSLTEIIIPSSVNSIDKGAFENCRSLKNVSIPDSIHLISFGMFSNCNSLSKIVIPTSIESIKNFAFSNCSSLTTITIPSSVMIIEESAFRGCKSLVQVEILSSLKQIKKSAFNGCSSLKQITIPSSVTAIGDGAFYGCSSLNQITIPSNVASIGIEAFKGCSSLTEVKFEPPSSITSIENGVFKNCSSLSHVFLPSSLEEIRESAFEGCSSLPPDSIPSNLIIPDSKASRCFIF